MSFTKLWSGIKSGQLLASLKNNETWFDVWPMPISPESLVTSIAYIRLQIQMDPQG